MAVRLRLLVALVVLVVGVASGTAVAEAQNGVAAINPESPAAVGADSRVAAGHVGSETRLFDDGTLGCCVAPQTTRPLGEIGPAGNPGALTAGQRAQYLADNWHSATFPNRTQSINYHLTKHGNGRTAFEYTRDAQQFFSQNQNLATQVTLRDGTLGLRIQTKVPQPGGGTTNVGGYWTTDGKLVTFWD